MLEGMRDPTGRSLHDRDTGAASETRQMVEADRRVAPERAAPYALVIAAIFVVIAVLLIVFR